MIMCIYQYKIVVPLFGAAYASLPVFFFKKWVNLGSPIGLINALHAGIFLMKFCSLLIFSKLTFSKNSFRNTIIVSNSLDHDQGGPDLCLNCLQRLSADNINRLRVHEFMS